MWGPRVCPEREQERSSRYSWNLLWPPAQEQKDFLSGSTWNPGFRSLEAQEQLKAERRGTSLLVQWLRHCASTAGSVGLIPGWGTKILHI